MWCPGCSHGGHLSHMREWFIDHQHSTCPSGCGHMCNAHGSLDRALAGGGSLSSSQNQDTWPGGGGHNRLGSLSVSGRGAWEGQEGLSLQEARRGMDTGAGFGGGGEAVTESC